MWNQFPLSCFSSGTYRMQMQVNKSMNKLMELWILWNWRKLQGPSSLIDYTVTQVGFRNLGFMNLHPVVFLLYIAAGVDIEERTEWRKAWKRKLTWWEQEAGVCYQVVVNEVTIPSSHPTPTHQTNFWGPVMVARGEASWMAFLKGSQIFVACPPSGGPDFSPFL